MKYPSKHVLRRPLLLAAISMLCALSSSNAATSIPLILTHYIPWFSSKPVSAHWGWHWTMNHFDPELLLPNGQRSAASHDYPLFGLYDCSDPDVIESQVLLMKLAGIDGVIIDWYGTKDFNDYALIHSNTQKLIPFLKRAGLKFALCYEDQSVAHMIDAGKLSPGDAVEEGASVLKWLEAHWFQDPSYIKHQGHPLLLDFGPQYFKKEQWLALFAPLKNRPLLYALPHLAEASGADGVFGWPPVAGAREIPPKEWSEYLDRLYQNPPKGLPVIAPVFPGFHDIYKEAGLHESYGFISERNGQTFTETLSRAIASGSDLIQIATWNDYGEGTVIEPTSRLGYRYLEELQSRPELSKRANRTAFTPADLKLPVTLFHLRKKHHGEEAVLKKLQKAANLILEGKCEEARFSLEALE